MLCSRIASLLIAIHHRAATKVFSLLRAWYPVALFWCACILLETPYIRMLFDPVLSYTYQSHISRYSYEDLPDRIDYVFITHNHQDHVLLETLLPQDRLREAPLRWRRASVSLDEVDAREHRLF
jgi:glyoxylase-like metal-dependent hydrolase (beta-lactamase superfamily II)